MAVHVVEQGEVLSSIAHRYGISSVATLRDDPENRDLFARRSDPNQLFPGDQVHIPEAPETQGRPIETGNLTRYRARRKRLRLLLKEPEGRAMKKQAYTLTFDGGEPIQAETDDGGRLDQPIPRGARTARLEIDEYRWNLRIGGLNPIEDTPDEGTSGIQARLANLGYVPGPVDGELGPRTRSALRAFQHDLRLDVTGRPDESTIARLASRHGT